MMTSNPPESPRPSRGCTRRCRRRSTGCAGRKLRPIQVEAIHEVFDGNGDLIISAGPRPGKTEAAFLPILSRIVAEPRGGVRAIYAGPLKALINDQFLRLEELCARPRSLFTSGTATSGRPRKKRLLESALRCPADHTRVDRVALRQPPASPRRRFRAARLLRDRRDAFVPRHRARRASQEPDLPTGGQEPRACPARRASATLGDSDAARRWLRAP